MTGRSGEPMELSSCRDISVVVLSHNRRAELQRTLDELRVPHAPWREVIVCDNGSTDGSPALVRDGYGDVRLIESGGNLGILASNLGYAAATGSWVLSLDDDSHPCLHTWGALDAALVAGDVDPRRVAAIALSTRSTAPEVTTTPADQAVLTPAFGFSAAGVLLSRHALEAVGTYDPELFLFTNELHWTARALEAGWPLLKCASSVVLHRAVPLQRSSARHAFYYCRNLLLFTLRHVPAHAVRHRLTRQLRDVLAFTGLHRTAVYCRAALDAWRMQGPTEGPRLSVDQLAAINPDWRAPYGYLG